MHASDNQNAFFNCSDWRLSSIAVRWKSRWSRNASGKVPDTLLAGRRLNYKPYVENSFYASWRTAWARLCLDFVARTHPKTVWSSGLGATLGCTLFSVGYFEVKNLRMLLTSLVYGFSLNIAYRQCYRVGLLWEHAILNLRANARVNNTRKRFSPAKSATHERHKKLESKISFDWRISRGDWFVFVWQPKW